MADLSINQVVGDLVTPKATLPGHYREASKVTTGGKDFSQMLLDGLNDVNDSQIKYSDLSLKAATDPSSVDAHDITIAAAEATMNLNIAKNVIDRVVQAYKDIITLR